MIVVFHFRLVCMILVLRLTKKFNKSEKRIQHSGQEVLYETIRHGKKYKVFKKGLPADQICNANPSKSFGVRGLREAE